MERHMTYNTYTKKEFTIQLTVWAVSHNINQIVWKIKMEAYVRVHMYTYIWREGRGGAAWPASSHSCTQTGLLFEYDNPDTPNWGEHEQAQH